MDMITIFQALFRWGIPALAGGVGALLLLLSIFLLYKKAFRGERTLTRKQIISAGLLCCWFLLVLGLTTLSRGANFSGSHNVDFLSGYISAWNHWSVSELQLILFNMLMFAPLGFLLPLLWKQAEKLWVTLAVSLCLTGGIELFQFFTGTGIFELDDLFHNLVGSLFGYFCILAILSVVRERKLRIAPVGKVLLIPCLICLILGTAFLIYDRKPYGNMSILPAVRQDLSHVQIVMEWEPSEESRSAAVYKSQFAEDKAYLEKVKTGLARLENLTFSRAARREDENLGYTGTDAEGRKFQMIFFFRTGEWNYTTFSETAAQLKEETAREERERYENWMNSVGLLPEGAAFSIQNGDTLRWDASAPQDISVGKEDFQKGSILIQLHESGAPVNFFYQVTWNRYVATEKLISQTQALEQVHKGNFEQYVPFQPGDMLHITNCELTYVYDTKGFYQPVYEFSGYLNQKDNLWTCRIPALPQ